MNIRAAVLSILDTGLFVDLAAGGQSQTALHFLFWFEIQATGNRGPALTNLSATTLATCFLERRSPCGHGQSTGPERNALWPGRRPWVAARARLRRELQREVAT